MAVHVLRKVSELGKGLVLAPERFDPRRKVEIEATRCLADIVDIVTDNVSTKSFQPDESVLVLDTTHAYEGFVVIRHSPAEASEMGSTKRLLAPGDVIISRLRPYLRQVALIDQALFELTPGGNAVVASTEFFVVRSRKGMPAAALVPFLLSEPVQVALAAGQEGGHHPRFSKELLASIPVPDFVVKKAKKTAAKVETLAADVRQALLSCRALVAEVGKGMSGGQGAGNA
jgi:hypothetical protein